LADLAHADDDDIHGMIVSLKGMLVARGWYVGVTARRKGKIVQRDQ